MIPAQTKYRRGFDWITMALYLSLMVVGYFMLFSALNNESFSITNIFNINNSIGKVTIIMITSVLIFLIGLLTESRFWRTFAYPIYGITVFLLILVLLLGSEIKGSTSWFTIFGFSIQPSEFAKFGTALAVASYCTFYKNNMKQRNIVIRLFGLIIIPVFLILLQPDAGSALVFFALVLAFYRAGLSVGFLIIPMILMVTFILALLFGFETTALVLIVTGSIFITFLYSRRWIITIVTLVLILGYIYLFWIGFTTWSLIIATFFVITLSVYFWMSNRRNSSMYFVPFIAVAMAFAFVTNYTFNHILKPHQQERINVWLNPQKCDPRGSLYNIIQSKLAIGSGGFEGKGYLNGTMTKLNYVPEQSTDFVFSTIGEEQGFIGSLTIIILFLVLILRVIKIGEDSQNRFVLTYAYCVAGYLFIHVFINIGMTMGLVPVIGIPLPFISKGGSSMMAFSLMMGVLLKFDATRKSRSS